MDITLGHLYTPKLPEDHFLLHTHETYEIYYMLTGIGHFYIEGTVYDIVPGTIMIMRPGEMHRAVIQPNTPYERMFLHFSADAIRSVDPELRLLQPFLERSAGCLNRYSLSNCNISFIDACFKNIDQMTDTNYDDGLMLRANLLPVLSEIKKSFLSHRGQGVYVADNDQISQIIYYIHLNFTQKLTKQMLCNRFYISPSHLSREFKRITGLTVGAYIRIKRLMLADQLISQGESVTGAAMAAGFSDYSTFYRAYRAHFQVSPCRSFKQRRAASTQDGCLPQDEVQPPSDYMK